MTVARSKILFSLPGEGVMRAVVRGADGHWFMSDEINHRLLVIAADGALEREVGGQGAELGRFRYPMGLLLCRERLLVCDSWNHRVQVFDLEGRPLGAFGRFGTDELGLAVPTDLCLGPDGELWVAEEEANRISVYDLDTLFDQPLEPETPKKRMLSLDGVHYPQRMASSGTMTALIDNSGVFLLQGDQALGFRALRRPAQIAGLRVLARGAFLFDVVAGQCFFLDGATLALSMIVDVAVEDARAVWFGDNALFVWDGAEVRQWPLPHFGEGGLVEAAPRDRLWRRVAAADATAREAARLIAAAADRASEAAFDLAFDVAGDDVALLTSWLEPISQNARLAYCQDRTVAELAALDRAAAQALPGDERRALSRDLVNTAERLSDAFLDERPPAAWLTQHGLATLDDSRAAAARFERWLGMLPRLGAEAKALAGQALTQAGKALAARRDELAASAPPKPDLFWELEADFSALLLARFQDSLMRLAAEQALKSDQGAAVSLSKAPARRVLLARARAAAVLDGCQYGGGNSASDALQAIAPHCEAYWLAKYALYVDPIHRDDRVVDHYRDVLAGRRRLEAAGVYRTTAGEVGAVGPHLQARDFFRDAAWAGLTGPSERLIQRLEKPLADRLAFAYDLACWHERTGDDARAAACYAKGPEDDVYWISGRARVAMRASGRDAALELLEKIRDQPGYRFWRGRFLQVANDFGGAVAEWDREPADSPWRWQCEVARVLTWLHAGELQRARAALTKAGTILDPRIHDYLAALTARFEGRLAESLAGFEALPPFECVHFQRGIAMRLLGRHDEASAAFVQEQAHFPKWPVVIQQAMTHLVRQDRAAAQNALATAPDYAWLLWAGKRHRRGETGLMDSVAAMVETEAMAIDKGWTALPDQARMEWARFHGLAIWRELDYESWP